MAKFHDLVRKRAAKVAPEFPLRLLFREVDTTSRFLGLVPLTDTEVLVVTDATVHAVRERLIGAKGRQWPLANLDRVAVDGSKLVLTLTNGELVGLQCTGREQPDDPMHAKNAWAGHDLIQKARGAG
jgi:hypothetical protein